jgi:hypothetical protein
MSRTSALVLVAVLCAGLSDARAETPLCVTVRSDEDSAGLRKLVESELAHHRSHRLVSEGCTGTLLVDLFRAGGARYLTARIDDQVPVRYLIKNAADLAERLAEALRLVLGSDPVYLSEDLSRHSAVQRAALSLVKRGHNRYRVELLEGLVRTAGGAALATGGARSFARGADHLSVYARLFAAGSATAVGTDNQPVRYLVGGEVGLLFEASRRAATTFYIGPLVSVLGMSLQGRVPTSGEVDSANRVDLAAGLRLGLRFLRTHAFDADVFAAGYFPVSNAKDVDSQLVQVYAPMLMLGSGVGF